MQTTLPPPKPKRTSVQMFIGGLPLNSTYSELYEVLQERCPIKNLKILKNPKTGLSKGFAFFTVRSQQDAKLMISQDLILRDRHLQAQNRTNNLEDNTLYRVFLGGIPLNTTDELLRQLFGQFGFLRAAYVIKDFKFGNSKGFAFVDFWDEESIRRCLIEKTIQILGKKIQLRRFEDRSKKRQVVNQYSRREEQAQTQTQTQTQTYRQRFSRETHNLRRSPTIQYPAQSLRLRGLKVQLQNQASVSLQKALKRCHYLDHRDGNISINPRQD